MRKFILFVIFLCAAGFSFAQLTGPKAIPGDYATIAAAITDLNAQGVGAGGVTFNVAAGHTETLAGKQTITATGTAANPIVFQKSGSGANPVITSYTGTVATPSVIADGMIVLAGSDYVTFDGIDLQEAAGNTTTASVMEYGFGLFLASATNGCQNNTIKNCVITLNRLQNTAWTAPGHNGSVGIAVSNGLHTATGAVTLTAASGSNSFNKFYSNTIQNCNVGIAFVGYAAPSPFTLGDTNNDVGGTSATTGNTIKNYGGAAAATNPAHGVFASNQWGLNCSYNTINNNDGGGVNHVSTLRGIFLNASSTSASVNCNNNNITLHSGATTSQVSFIENSFGSTAAGNTVNINNNTCTADYLTATTGSFFGIYNTATPATLNIQNNTIDNVVYSDASLTGTGTVYPIYSTASSSTTTKNITGNTVNNINRSGSTGGTTIGIYVSSGTTGMVVNINGNTVTNMSIDGTGTASTLYGIQASTGTISINNNNVNNLQCLKTTGTGALYGIYDISAPVNENYNNNDVHALIHNGTGTVYGIYANTAAGTRTTTGNLVYNLFTGGTTIAGINMTNSSPNVFKNKIYDIESSSTGAPTVSGILLVSTATSGTANIYNNLIGDLKAPNAVTTTTPTIRGINITGTSTTSNFNVSFNSVFLNASSSGANFGTAALYATVSTTATSGNLTLKNNVLVNQSLPAGTGFSVAYQRSGTALNNYASASNNNLFYAGTPSASNLIFYDGTNSDQNMGAFKTRVAPGESASVSENPNFLSTTGSSTDFLHVDPAIATQIESGGIPVAGITDDYDGNTRNVTTPDMGADEFTGIGADLTGPSIAYTLLTNTSCVVNAVLAPVTISDASGVNIAPGTRPRLYYKKSTNANTFNDNTSGTDGWKYVEATGAGGSPFSFTTDFTLLFGGGGATTGDVIQYFVVAEDNAGTPNVSINNGTFAANPASVALTAAAFPIGGTINSYTFVAAGLTGTVTVGAAGTYPTLTGTGGLFEAINTNGMSGALTANILDASITEPGTVALNGINYNGCAAGPYTVLIKPDAGVSSVLTGAVGTGAVIKLNGADYVTIDGSNNGTNTRNLTIQNTTATTSGNAVVWLASPAVGNGAGNNTIKNCIVEGNSATTSFTGIHIGGSTTIGLTTAGNEANSNNTISNNLFRKTQYGTVMFGYSATAPDLNNVISNNNFGTATTGEGFSLLAINADRQQNLIVSGNEVQNVVNATNTSSTPFGGIRLLDFKNGQCFNNNVHDLAYTGTSTPKIYGIAITSSTYTTAGNPSNALVYNNAVSRITSTGTSAVWNLTGILASAGYGDRFYHNSVHLTGQLSNTTSGLAAAFANGDGNITTTCTNIDVRNNIFSVTGSNGATGGNYWAYYTAATTLAGSTLNYNDLYCNATNVTNNIGRFNSLNYTTLATWQTGTGQEANSINLQPVFVSNTDLHLVPASNFLLDNFGTPIAAVTTDIDGAARSATAPDMGVDEFTAPTVTDAAPTAITVPVICVGSNPVSVTVKNLGTVTITSLLIDWSVTPGGAQPQFNPGAISLAPGASQTFVVGNFTFVAGTIYSMTATTSSPNGGADGVPGNDAFTQNNLQTGLVGTYTVGAGGNFSTLTAAVAEYNSRGLCGPVVFSLTDANYSTSETFPISINANTSASAINTLTIKPATGVSPLITGAVGTGAIIKLNGADYVTIEGSNNNTTSRNLTIQNTTATSTGNAVVWMASPASGNGSTYNTVKNCVIEGNSATTSFLGMYVGGNTTISLTAAGLERNNNNTITNNLFRKTQHGLALFGYVAATPDQNNVVSNNNFGTATAGEGFALTGINADRQENMVVSGNEIRNITNATTASNVFGIRLLDFKNGQAYNNKIHSMSYTGTSTPKYYGIAITSSSYTTVGNPSNALIFNNAISNITSTGTSTVWNTTGILAGAGYGDRFYHNTVHLAGQLANSASGLAAAFANGDGNITAVGTNIDVRNNIFSITGSSGVAGGNFWAYYTPATTLTGTTLNYNDLYCNGTNVTNNIGRFNAVNNTTLAAWQTATGQEANSINVLPSFISNIDLHLDNGNNVALDNLGTPLAAVTADIDGDTRSATAPDMGVDEFASIPCTEAIGGLGVGSAFGCVSYTGTISASGYSTGVGTTYQWVSAPSATGPWTVISGATTPSSYTISPAITTTTYYRLAVACPTSASVDSSSVIAITIVAKPTVPISPAGPLTICAPATQTLSASGSTAASPSYVWLRNNVVISGATTVTYGATTAGNYRVRITDGVTGCFDTSAVVILNVNPQPANIVATATPDTVCIGGNVNLTSSASVGYNMNPAGTETFIDIDANPTTTSITGLADDSEHNIGMPQFTFNGVTYTTARVGMNGAVALGSTTGDITTTNAALPSTSNTAGNVLLAPWWDDLDILTTPLTTIKLDTVGTKFIIQWTNTGHNNTIPATDVIKFQIQMDTANGNVHFVYNDVSFGNATYDAGISATVGVQWNATSATQYSFNTASLTAGQCITFSPATVGYTWSGPNGFTSTAQNPTLTNLSSLDSGMYQVVFTNVATGCTDTAFVNVHVRPTTTSEWIGAVSTDWNTAGNWACGNVPTTTSTVIIRNSVPNYPVITQNVEIKTLTVRTGASVTVGAGFELKLNGTN